MFKVSSLVTLLIVFSILLTGIPACSPRSGSNLKIGVLLPLTGPDALDSQEVLNWAAENLNSFGGVGGSPVGLVYKDTYNQDIQALSRELIADPSIQIVIGPQRSSELLAIAPLFIEAKKLLISPTATAGYMLRAYGKKDFIWRTCQSDVVQIRSILFELATRGVTRISLIYTEDEYGETFLEWTGFFCTELRIDLLRSVGYDSSTRHADVLEEALSGDPEYIVTVAFAAEAVTFKKLLDARGVKTRLFFTDSAEAPYVIEKLGAASEGIEVMSPAADPESNFETSYLAEFGYYPWDAAAPTYDAFILAVYTLARQQSQRGIFHKERLEVSFQEVIHGRGSVIEWNESSRAVNLILKGGLPDVAGASGPLSFDREFGVDPTESFYSLNRVETVQGITEFNTVRRFNSNESAGVGLLAEGASAVSVRANLELIDLRENETVFQPGVRDNLQAVIISLSSGWNNYRHQSDALAVYDMLKNNGVADKDIILFSVDDVPWLPENPLNGNIHHQVKGANIREKASIDYSGEQVNVENLSNVLLGNRSENTPVVLESDGNTNILIYLVGHGIPGAVDFQYGAHLTSSGLSRIVSQMNTMQKYRQMLIVAESCYGESLGMDLDSPGVAFLTGASRIEASFGAVYDHYIKQWLADDFTVQTLTAMLQPGITLEDLYLTVYDRVAGSHVKLVNYAAFGDLDTPVADFINP